MFYNPIETPRLCLTNISRDDADFIFAQFSNDAITRYLFDEEPMQSVDEANELIDFYLEPEPRCQHRWIVRLKDGLTPVGTCGFHCYDSEDESVELGYDLLAEYRGRGIMTEAVTEMLAQYVPKLGVRRVNAHIYPENAGSVNLARRLGFAFRGETVTYEFRGKDYLHEIWTLDCPAKK